MSTFFWSLCAPGIPSCVFLSLFSAICLSLDNFFCGLNAELSFFLITGTASVAYAAFSVPEAIIRHRELAEKWSRGNVAPVVIGGVLLTLKTILYNVALQTIHIGDATTIYFLMVVWVPLIESVWRRRCVSIKVIIGVVLSGAGVLFITHPSLVFGHDNHAYAKVSMPKHPELSPMSKIDMAQLGYLCAFLSSILNGAVNVVFSAYPSVDAVTWNLVSGVMGAVASAVGFVAVRAYVDFLDNFDLFTNGISLILISFFKLMGQTFVIFAVHAHSPSVYVLVSTTDIPLSYVWGWVWLGQQLRYYHFVGGGLILGAIFLISCPNFWEIWEGKKRKKEKWAEEDELNEEMGLIGQLH